MLFILSSKAQVCLNCTLEQVREAHRGEKEEIYQDATTKDWCVGHLTRAGWAYHYFLLNPRTVGAAASYAILLPMDETWVAACLEVLKEPPYIQVMENRWVYKDRDMIIQIDFSTLDKNPFFFYQRLE